MKDGDKFLVAIVMGVILLVGISVLVVVTRPEPAYQLDDTPEGVAHNYLLALQREEFARAHGYLSTQLPGYPSSASRFAEDVRDNSWVFRLGTDTSLAVEESRITGARAEVTVRESRFYAGGLFNSEQRMSTFTVQLHRQDGQWRITDADRYFVWCWSREEGCR